MSLLQNSNAISSGGYDLTNSLRFRTSASASLTRTPTTAGNRKTWTMSMWAKRGKLSAYAPIFSGYSDLANKDYNSATVFFDTDDTLYFSVLGTIGASVITARTPAVFRDPSAWYHIVVALDTNQATNSNGLKIYVNGVQQTLTFTSYTQNAQPVINSTTLQYVGAHLLNTIYGVVQYFDGYMAEVNFVDGQALTPSSFGSTNATTGVWQPAKYTGTYGTNGFYLKFADTSAATAAAIGKDSSGNGNNWTPNNISVTAGTTYDAMTDVPTNTSATVANYAVMNPVFKNFSQPTFSNANLTTTPNAANYQNAASTINVTSGKWYAEFTTNGTPNSANLVGISSLSELNTMVTTATYVGNSSTGYSFQFGVPNKINNGVTTSYGSIPSSGGVIMMAFDLDNGKIWWGLNGTWFSSGDPAAGTNAAFTGITGSNGYSIVTTVYSGGLTSLSHNFGQRPFAYTPPTGFKALNTYNL